MKQTGMTSEQMKNAPPNATYVWVNSRLDYPIALAESLGRTDLNIVSSSYLCPRLIQGTRNKVVIDHAYEFYDWTPERGLSKTIIHEIAFEAVRYLKEHGLLVD